MVDNACEMEVRYHRAQHLMRGIFTNNISFNDMVYPVWIENSDCFWYERTTKAGTGDAARFGKEYRLVDANATTNQRAFDHKMLAVALAKVAKQDVDADNLPIDKVNMSLDPVTLSFDAFDKRWQFNGQTETCTEIQCMPDEWVLSPDGEKAVFTSDNNLWVRNLVSSGERALTRDGHQDYAYAAIATAWGIAYDPTCLAQALWSPDSQWVFTIQRDTRQVKTLPVVDHVPTDGSLRPQLQEVKVAYPGDDHVETLRLVAIHVETGRLQEANYRQIPVTCNGHGFFTEGMGWWGADSRHIYFVDMERDYKTVRVVEFNAETGITRILIEETADTHLNLSQNNDERPTFMPLPESNEVLWFSERSGWAHIYLYDLETGQFKHSVTQGEWLVRDISYFDAARREIFVQTAGRDKHRDPYYRDLVRINIDTGDITTLTDSDHDYVLASKKNGSFGLAYNIQGRDIGNTSGISPSGKFAVVTRSRADEVSVSLLLDRKGKEILTLETTDISGLMDDWQWPEPVKLMAADGKTDIYGLVFRPSDFSSTETYPIVSHVFNVPDACWVSRGSFGNGAILNWPFLDAAALAELGFIVVQIDGRGTPWRHKAFQDESYGNYHAASTLDDHVSGIQQLAKRYPYMDLNRVGIFSPVGSDGGVLGLLQFPDFYKVGVNGDCLHDTRLEAASMVAEMYEGMSVPTYLPVEEQVDKLQGKLLLIHGMLNTMAPPATTFRVVEALQSANKDFDMLLLPKMGHALFPDYLMRRAWDYLIENLMKAKPPAEFPLKITVGWTSHE